MSPTNRILAAASGIRHPPGDGRGDRGRGTRRPEPDPRWVRPRRPVIVPRWVQLVLLPLLDPRAVRRRARGGHRRPRLPHRRGHRAHPQPDRRLRAARAASRARWPSSRSTSHSSRRSSASASCSPGPSPTRPAPSSATCPTSSTSANDALHDLQVFFDDNGIDVEIERQGETALSTLQSRVLEGSGEIVSITGEILTRARRDRLPHPARGRPLDLHAHLRAD